jgi:sortase A
VSLPSLEPCTGSETADRASVGPLRTRRSGRRALRRAANAAIVLGLLTCGWALWTWQWGDPVTGAVTAWEQRELGREYERVVRSYAAATPAAAGKNGVSPLMPAVPLAEAARRYRLGSRAGDAIARLRIGRIGVRAVVVNGTAAGDLRRGPGRDLRTFMPGEGERAYVAGHRTTFGAPFAHIDALRAGDRIELDLPYARFIYAVVGHRIVDDQELSVLRSRGREELLLQACHPRFSASERYIVFARTVGVTR